MKINALRYLVVAAISLSSCIKVFHYGSLQKTMLTDDGKVYLEKDNGEKIYGSTIKFSKKDMISIDGNKYPLTDITAYQTKTTYNKRFKEVPEKRQKGDVYMYVPQIKRGKINVYQYESWLNDGTPKGSTITAFRVQKPGADWYEYFYARNFRDYIKDNKKALDYFNSVFTVNKTRLDKYPKALLKAIDLYNEN